MNAVPIEIDRLLLTCAQFPERKATNIFDTLNNEKEARMSDRYNVSKLLEVFACRALARDHRKTRRVKERGH